MEVISNAFLTSNPKEGKGSDLHSGRFTTKETIPLPTEYKVAEILGQLWT
jgi:hypothetical protein